MKTPSRIASLVPGLTPAVALSLALGLLLAGCVSGKYKDARKNTPPPQLLNVAFPAASLQATLNAVITFDGPGSWKRNAFWDEYAVTLHNPGNQPLTISTAGLTDFADTFRPVGSNPWALEKESKTLEQKYRDAGIAFVRYSVPGVILAGAGVGLAEASLMSASAAGAATVCLVALPVYYAGVITINHHNKVAMEKEFQRRRLALPLTLAAGETRTGSFFFPMVPSPRSLDLHWSVQSESAGSSLALGFLHGLHLKAMAAPASAN